MTSFDAVMDCLYGPVTFQPEIGRLIGTPVVQRLRHVRLSNIDSLAMPGISGGSRFEHVLGVAHLGSQLGFVSRLSRQDAIVLTAAALLHDWAITAFGHLVEEGFAYAGIQFDHEHKLDELAANTDESTELGGINRQVLCGRESGLGAWIQAIAPRDRDTVLDDIVSTIRGKGKFGRVVTGDIDVDNIDGVFRIAHHMGLAIDKSVPLRLARAIVGVSPETKEPIYTREAEALIAAWMDLRGIVYQHLMPAQPDFAAKLMLLRCTMLACEMQEILPQDWNLTDFDFITRLRGSASEECRKTVDRWQVGEFWNTSPLIWLEGQRPSYAKIAKFSADLTNLLGRQCFAYGIKDKRVRECRVSWDDGSSSVIGIKPNKWLFGVGTPVRKSFGLQEIRKLNELACKYFETHEVPGDITGEDASESQRTLL